MNARELARGKLEALLSFGLPTGVKWKPSEEEFGVKLTTQFLLPAEGRFSLFSVLS